MHPHLIDIAGAAPLAKSTPRTIRRLVCAGTIPGTRVGGQWRLHIPAFLEAVIGADAARQATPRLPDDWTEPAIVTGDELAHLLGLPERTVKILLQQGRIPATKFGGTRWRAYWPSILAKIAAGQPLVDRPDNPDAGPPADPDEQEECL